MRLHLGLLVFYGVCVKCWYIFLYFGRSTAPVHIRKKTLLVGFNEGAAHVSSVHANGVPLLILCGCFVFSLYLSLERERERTLQHMDVCVSSIPLGQSLSLSKFHERCV